MTRRSEFPSEGTSREVLREMMDAARAEDVDWRGGRVSVYTHFGGDDVLEVAKEASLAFFSENALGPTAFPSLARFEDDIVAWTLSLLGAPAGAIGSMTSGGSESILMAVKTARDWAAATRPIEGVPQAIVPYTAHPAFDKAGHYLGVEITRVAVGDDLRADVDAMAEAIGPRTIMLVGSAPQFPYGLFDPIEALSTLARSRDLWLHVDACVGGFVAPFARALGHPIPAFDFALTGVSSMSADLHKYGYSAKGASLVLFREQSMREYQRFVFDQWPRGVYRADTVAGTRPGGPIASAWAVLQYLGRSGYERIVGDVLDARDRLADGIRAIDGLHLLCEPELTIMLYTSDTLDIFAIAQAMEARGWFVTRAAEPPAIHLGMLTMSHVPVVDRYLDDLAASVDAVATSGATAAPATVTYGG